MAFLNRASWAYIFTFSWLICAHLFRIDGNWSDVLPYARAQMDSNWVPHDWYLHAAIGYRDLFNVLAGQVYKQTSIEFIFFAGRLLVYGAFSYLIVEFFRLFKIPYWTLAIFLTLHAVVPFLTAGEWWLDEFDTKAFAYFFCLFSVLGFIQNRWRWSAFALGLACSFHLLVGFYFTCLLAATFLITAKLDFRKNKIQLMTGALLFMVGAGNALAFAYSFFKHAGDPQAASLANSISVHMRLAHHLWPGSWSALRVAALMMVFAIALLKLKSSQIRYLRELRVFFALNAFLFLSGIVAWKLEALWALNLYPFRVPDVMLPIVGGLALSAWLGGSWLRQLGAQIPTVAIALSLAFAGYLAYFNFADLSSTWKRLDHDSYSWIRINTNPAALFVTDPSDRYFSVLAERAQIATYKKFPQLAPDIVEWKNRVEDLGCKLKPNETRFHPKTLSRCYQNRSATELVKLARKYGADFVMTSGEYESPALKQVFKSEAPARSKVYQVVEKTGVKLP